MTTPADTGCSARQRGLTLIELVIAIVVLAIVTLVTGPSLIEALARNTLKGAADEAFADLHYARSEAVQRKVTVNVVFTSSGYTITSGMARTLKSVSFNGPTLAAGAGATIIFDPVRTGADATGMPVEFAHAQTRATLRVSVNPLGRAEICSPSGTMAGYGPC